MSESIAETVTRWKGDSAAFVRECFRAEPDAWQLETLRAFDDDTIPRIAMQACAGPGKSTVEAWCGWHFLLCRGKPGKHPNGAAISITGENLKNGLWKEFAVWYNRAPLLQRVFDMTTERIFSREHPRTWFLSARSYSKNANPDEQGRTLSGLHAPYILYLLDETGDMNPAVGRAAEQGLSNCEWGKILQAGNTTSQTGYLYVAAAKQRSRWHVIAITADPDDPRRTPRVPAEYAAEQIALYGRENPWVMAYILGKFPPSGINSLLGADEVNAALGRHLRIDQYEMVQKRLGIDVARFGDDATVIFPRQGLAAFNPVVMRGARTDAIAARVVMAKQRWGSELELIDATGGWGAGVVDIARQGGVHILEINAGGRADDVRYFNKRSETAFRAADWIKRGGALPNLPAIVEEATAATYSFQDGKFRVEEKAQIKARIGKSPDLWDAFCLTFALVDMPAAVGLPPLAGGAAGRALSDWDPMVSA